MKRRRRGIRIFATIFILLLLCFGGLVALTYGNLMGILKDPDKLMAKLSSLTGNNSDVVSLVLYGIDSDSAREAQRKGYRTDTIVVLAIDLGEKNATAITIPRDTRVNVREYDSDGKLEREGPNKINAAFSLGGRTKEQRYDNAMKSVGELLSSSGKKITIDKYAGIDMDGISQLNDAVGGVSVTLDIDIPGVGDKGETVKLSGSQAETFARTRHVGDGSDVGRAKRQQQFILNFAKEVKKKGVSGVLSMYGDVTSFIDTNLSLDEVAAFAGILNTLDVDEIEFITAPGKAKTMDGKSYYIVDEDKLKELVDDIYQ